MRRLPSKAEILERARQISTERAVIQGLPAITPTDAELKESGVFHEARLELMSTPETRGVSEQHRYLADMASELNLKVLQKQAWRQLQRKYAGYRWHIKGLSSLLMKHKDPFTVTSPMKRKPSKPKPKRHRKPSPIFPIIEAKPKPKKRTKRHISRTGKTMRKLRKRVKNGQKTFSFPDSIWKVRKR